MQRSSGRMALLFCLVLPLLLGASPDPSHLTVRVDKWAGGVDPTTTLTLEGIIVVNQVYETLVSFGPGSQILPNLVETWKFDRDQLRFDFKLRPGITFADGAPLTTDDIKRVFEAIILSGRFKIFDKITGAQAFRDKKTKAIAGFVVKDKLNFSIGFDIFVPKFLEEIADSYATISRPAPKGKNSWPVGTGPYQIVGVDPKSEVITLARNDRYRGTPPNFSQITLVTKDSDAVDISLVEPTRPNHPLTKQSTYFDTEVYFISFNAGNPKLADQDVRLRLGAYLTPQLVDATLGPVSYKIGGYIPLGLPGFDPALKAQAPKSTSAKLPSVTVTNYLPAMVPLATAYCEALKKDDVGCVVKQVDVDTLLASKKDDTLEILFLRQKSTSYSADNLLSIFAWDSVFNFFTKADAKDALAADLTKRFLEMQNISSSENAHLLQKMHQFDQHITNLGLAKSYRYGGEKRVWLKPGIEFPALDTLGPFALRFDRIKRQ